jgi:hypothetical protein
VANRRYLRSGDHHYTMEEKLRSGSAEATAALSPQGRYQEVAANLRVKEVRISEDERFVICCNPEAAERDAPPAPGWSPSSKSSSPASASSPPPNAPSCAASRERFDSLLKLTLTPT